MHVLNEVYMREGCMCGIIICRAGEGDCAIKIQL